MRLGETVAIVVCYVDECFTIKQRLVRLQLLAKSMSGEEIAREIITASSMQYSISSDLLVAVMHDRAACNGVVLQTLQIVTPLIQSETNSPFHTFPPLQFGGVAFLLTAQNSSCFGRREQEDSACN